jgi:ADP-ribosylglycohydrolase
MLGAIIGDIVGSVYERNNLKDKHFRFFKDKCRFTDDTVMTIAVAEALWRGGKPEHFISSMKKFGRAFPNAGYGARFKQWLLSDDAQPYNSYGNGAAMRVSPVSHLFTLEAVENYAKISAEVTHNHPEGIKGAQAVAAAGFIVGWWREYDDRSIEEKKAEMKAHIEREYGYNLSQSLDEIRPNYRCDVSCQGTVPQAMIAFLESNSFEDAIRNAISLGGDSDTLAAITGGIAEACYGYYGNGGISKEHEETALSYLPEKLKNAVWAWQYKTGFMARVGLFHDDPDLDFLGD